MSRIRIILIIVTILSGIDIGLLWSGGATSMAHTPEQGNIQAPPISNDPAIQPTVQGVQPMLVEIRPPNSTPDPSRQPPSSSATAQVSFRDRRIRLSATPPNESAPRCMG